LELKLVPGLTSVLKRINHDKSPYTHLITSSGIFLYR
jgi:hypothetical protein